MAYSFDLGTTDGTTVVFPFHFVGIGRGYLRDSDVHVEIRDEDTASWVETHKFVLETSNSIRITGALIPAPTDGKPNIRIRRIMPKDATYANWSTGQNYTDYIINNSFWQQLYTMHEVLDGFLTSFNTNINLNGSRITNVGTPVDDGDAVNLGFLKDSQDPIVIAKYATKEWAADTFGNANLLSNHNFLIQTPDNSQPKPDSTPRNYPPSFQIFSGVFANATTGITNLTYIDGRVSFSGGDLYFAVPNTGAIAHLDRTQLVASVADFDGKPRTRGVSFALVGDEYRVTVGIDALEDAGAVLTPLGSVKLEQGSVATGHEIDNENVEVNKIKVSEISGVVRRLTRSEIISTDPVLSNGADSTAAINAFLDQLSTGSIFEIEIDGTYGITSDLTYTNKNVIWKGCGIDVEGSAFKMIQGRDSNNTNIGFFTVRGSRFVSSGDFRLIAPACYAPSNPNYNPNHTLNHAFNLLWRQEEGDRVNTTLSYSRVHIGRYDADGWSSEFRDRECRQVKYGFTTPNEAGFNNDGNNDFHQFDTVVMFHVDVAARIENRQNLGWRFKNLQFFFGTSVDNLPIGGQIYYENLWIAGTTGVNGVFVSGESGSTSEIARRYIHNLNAEGIRNDHFIEAVGDSVVTKISGGGSIGFRTKEGAQSYCDFVKLTNTVRSDIRITGHQILEDTGSGDTADFRLRYDTGSKENNLFFDECWGDYFDTTSFQTGAKNGWSVQFRDVKPVSVNRRTDFSQNGSYSYLVNYSSDSALRDGFGRIPLSKIYDIGYMQQVSALAVGRLGVDSLTVVKSKTLRVKPTAATSFIVGNIIEEGWRVIGIDAYFVYNDLGANYFSVESGDATPFQFGSGVSNGSGSERISPLTGGDNGLLFVDNNRLRVRGFSDAALTSPASFSGSASGISDSTTIAITVHYIDLDRRYLDVGEYNKLSVTDGI